MNNKKFEIGKKIESKEKAWDPSALNSQEEAVVDYFAESYWNWFSGWWWSSWDNNWYRDEEARKKAKQKLEAKINFVKNNL